MVEIKLYNESSDRPHGSYTKIKGVILIYTGGLIDFDSSSGERIITNLKFKMKKEKDETIEINIPRPEERTIFITIRKTGLM